MSLQLFAKPVLEKITNELLGEDKQGVSLGLIYLGDNPVIEKFVQRKLTFAQKIGIPTELVQINQDELGSYSFDDIAELISRVSGRHSGVVIQLPLPEHFRSREQEILDLVPVEKDIDVLSARALDLFSKGLLPFTPAVTGSIAELASFYGISFEGKKIAIVGKGKLVGLPVAKFFDARNIPYEVFVSGDDVRILREYDIIIAGTGVSGLLKSQHVTSKTIVFDAGTSEKEGVIVGDLDPQCYEEVFAYSPVPGGIGPLTIAILFKNLVATKKEV